MRVDFGLLCAHMVGDYILQNDWMAANKINPKPAQLIHTWTVDVDPMDRSKFADAMRERNKAFEEHPAKLRAWWIGHLACTVHCLLYTLAVWAFSFWWMPWWGLAACFAAHWPIDRFRLAGRWMRNVSGQAFFASDKHPMFPNSVVLVDNTFHLVTLFVIAAIHFGGA